MRRVEKERRRAYEPTPQLEPVHARPSEALKEAVIGAVVAIEDAKRDAGREPAIATRIELGRYLDDALNELYASGRIRVGDTMNDKYITIINGKNEQV